MSALKELIKHFKDGGYEKDVAGLQEISDRLDRLEQQAHVHAPSVTIAGEVVPESTIYTQDERSCDDCFHEEDCMDNGKRCRSGDKKLGAWEPKAQEQEQGGDDEHDDTMDDGEITDGFIMDGKIYYTEKVVDDLRARLAVAESNVAKMTNALATGNKITIVTEEYAAVVKERDDLRARLTGMQNEHGRVIKASLDMMQMNIALKEENAELKRQLAKSEVKG